MIYNINGSFEAGDVAWPIKERGSEYWEIIKDPAQAHSGEWVAVRHGVSALNAAMRTALIAVTEGDTIQLSCYVKRVGSSGSGYVRVSLRDENNNEIQIVSGNMVTSSSYERSSLRTVIPAGIRLFRVDLVGSNNVGTEIYFDDVTLELLNESSDADIIATDPSFDDPWTLGRSRVATQYTQSPKFLAWLKALLDPGVNIKDVLLSISQQTDIDTARGYNLDVLGEIVGVSRIVPESIALTFFGFQGQTASTPFGEEGILNIGARFRDEAEAAFISTVLADPEYRTLIKAKIIKNHNHGTPEEIISALSFLFGADSMMIEDNGGMEISLVVGRQLTAMEIALIDGLDILPRPAAVKINRRTMFIPDNYFGFEGQPKAKPFGEETDPSIGGLFAEEF